MLRITDVPLGNRNDCARNCNLLTLQFDIGRGYRWYKNPMYLTLVVLMGNIAKSDVVCQARERQQGILKQ